MKKEEFKKVLLLVVATIIWGFAFVAQSAGGDLVGPFTFNTLRVIIGSVFIFLMIFISDKTDLSKKPKNKKEYIELIKGGIFTGLALFLASNLQQLGIYYVDSVGKAGFLTSTYIIMVPLAGLFFKKKVHLNVFIAVIIDLFGLYLLCISDSFRLNVSDIYLLSGAFFFMVQILLVDKYASKVDKMRYALVQYITSGILGIILCLLVEPNGLNYFIFHLNNFEMWKHILYAGILSTGVAYTIQIICQDGLNPTLASIVMSLESVFSAIGGFLILNQLLSTRELYGCIVVFVAVILAQLK